MAIDYIRLEDSLSTIINRLLPAHVKSDSAGLYRHFEAKRDHAWQKLMSIREENQASFNRAAALGSAGGLAGIGLVVVAGPATIPVGAAVSLLSAGYFAARGITNKLLDAIVERDLQKKQDLLDHAAHEEFVGDGRRTGLLTRIYRRVADTLSGYEAKASRINARIDNLAGAGAADVPAVKRILAQEVSAGFAEYLRRNVIDSHSKSAHLMSRLNAIADVRDLMPETGRSAPSRGEGPAVLSGVLHGGSMILKGIELNKGGRPGFYAEGREKGLVGDPSEDESDLRIRPR